MSLSPPVTASTLNNESMSSLTANEGPQGHEVVARLKEDPGVGESRFWSMKDGSKAKIRTDPGEETFAKPKPSRRRPATLSNSGSLGRVVSERPFVLDVKLDGEATARREKTQVGMTGGKLTPHKTGGTIRRVWRSIVDRM